MTASCRPSLRSSVRPRKPQFLFRLSGLAEGLVQQARFSSSRLLLREGGGSGLSQKALEKSLVLSFFAICC